MEEIRRHFAFFRQEYVLNLDKINELEDFIKMGNYQTDTEKDIALQYYTNFMHLNDLFYDLITLCQNEFKQYDDYTEKMNTKFFNQENVENIISSVTNKAEKLFNLYDSFKSLSSLDKENSYVLFIKDENLIINPSNDNIALKLGYEYNGDPFLSLIELTQTGNRLVDKSYLSEKGEFKIGDSILIPEYDIGSDKIKRLEVIKNPDFIKTNTA